MKRYVVLAVLGLFTLGCWNDNSLTINNQAIAAISVAFRGQEYSVAAGGSHKVSDIPSGEFTYSTVYTIPASAKSVTDGAGLTGSLKLYNNSTQYLLIYTSVLRDSVYAIDATLSSSNDQSIVR